MLTLVGTQAGDHKGSKEEQSKEAQQGQTALACPEMVVQAEMAASQVSPSIVRVSSRANNRIYKYGNRLITALPGGLIRWRCCANSITIATFAMTRQRWRLQHCPPLFTIEAVSRGVSSESPRL